MLLMDMNDKIYGFLAMCIIQKHSLPLAGNKQYQKRMCFNHLKHIAQMLFYLFKPGKDIIPLKEVL